MRWKGIFGKWEFFHKHKILFKKLAQFSKLFLDSRDIGEYLSIIFQKFDSLYFPATSQNWIWVGYLQISKIWGKWKTLIDSFLQDLLKHILEYKHFSLYLFRFFISCIYLCTCQCMNVIFIYLCLYSD
jgi:hypothetical protein